MLKFGKSEHRKVFWLNVGIAVYNIAILIFCAVSTILIEKYVGQNCGVICLMCILKQRLEEILCRLEDKK